MFTRRFTIFRIISFKQIWLRTKYIYMDLYLLKNVYSLPDFNRVRLRKQWTLFRWQNQLDVTHKRTHEHTRTLSLTHTHTRFLDDSSKNGDCSRRDATPTTGRKKFIIHPPMTIIYDNVTAAIRFYLNLRLKNAFGCICFLFIHFLFVFFFRRWVYPLRARIAVVYTKRIHISYTTYCRPADTAM